MLFGLKRSLAACTLAAVILAGTSLLGIRALDLPLGLGTISWVWALAGAGLMLSGDAVLHLFLTRTGGEAYRSRFQSLIEYFRGQGVGEIAAGSVLAVSEELFFRGLLLGFLTFRIGAPFPIAAALTSVAFGLAHLIPKAWAWPFAIWAAWEGILLGGIYLASGSLSSVALAHAIHDAVGFVVFARIRARGVL